MHNQMYPTVLGATLHGLDTADNSNTDIADTGIADTDSVELSTGCE